MKYLYTLTTILFLFVAPTPAYAGTPAVMVELHVTGSQEGNARWAVRYVDTYTRTRMVIGKCTDNRRCIRLYTSNNRTDGTGWSSWRGSARPVVTTTVNPARGDGYMKRLWAHELGHAFWLGHSTYRTNLMYPTLFKKGNRTMVPIRFTDHQRTILRRH